jgi:uncharacterized OsmC-like protein
MAEIDVLHIEGDRFLMEMRDHALVVDQPTEAGGDDLGPTPTELFVGSLAACAAFYAERYLRRHDLPVEGLHVRARFEMWERPARVGAVRLEVALAGAIPAERRAALLAVIEHCTVHNSIRTAPEITIGISEAAAVAA